MEKKFDVLELEPKILALFVRSEQFFLDFKEVLKEVHFLNVYHQMIHHLRLEYGKSYDGPMTSDAIKHEIRLSFLKKYAKKPPVTMTIEQLYQSYYEEVDFLFNLDIADEKYIRDQLAVYIWEIESRKILLNIKDGDSATVALDKIKKIAEKIRKGLKKSENILFKLRTCDDVNENITDEDIWYVKGLIAKHAINTWYGPPGGGKSHLLWLLGNYLNDGKEISGGPAIQQTPVFYFDLENSESVRGHIKKICGGGKMKFISLEDDIPIPLISEEEEFKTFILSNFPPAVIIIDTAAMLIPSKGWVEGKWDVTPIVRTLKQLCAKEYTFVLIFHNLKGDQKTIKSPQELLAQSDHVVALYPVERKGTDKEKDELPEDDPNKPRIHFCGTRRDLKSRFEKSTYWLQFDPNPNSSEKGFKWLGDLDVESLRDIRQRFIDWVQVTEKDRGEKLTATEYPNRGQFQKMIEGWGYPPKRTRDVLIPKGFNLRYWDRNEIQTKSQMQHHYYPNFERLIKDKK